uniref:HD2 protein n=1 Tax=Volvariella volvacea TaxID=36659 RepID=A0A096YDT1_9AGAR|nr:HD2 protein [Volvariella volvacea]
MRRILDAARDLQQRSRLSCQRATEPQQHPSKPLPLELPPLLDLRDHTTGLSLSEERVNALSATFRSKEEELRKVIQSATSSALTSRPHDVQQTIRSSSVAWYERTRREWLLMLLEQTKEAEHSQFRRALDKPRFNYESVPLLEEYFKRNAYPSAPDRTFLAKKTKMTPKQIEVWVCVSRIIVQGLRRRESPYIASLLCPLSSWQEKCLGLPTRLTKAGSLENPLTLPAESVLPKRYHRRCLWTESPAQYDFSFSSLIWPRQGSFSRTRPPTLSVDELTSAFEQLSLWDNSTSTRRSPPRNVRRKPWRMPLYARPQVAPLPALIKKQTGQDSSAIKGHRPQSSVYLVSRGSGSVGRHIVRGRSAASSLPVHVPSTPPANLDQSLSDIISVSARTFYPSPYPPMLTHTTSRCAFGQGGFSTIALPPVQII